MRARFLDTVGVAGSIPVEPTIFPKQITPLTNVSSSNSQKRLRQYTPSEAAKRHEDCGKIAVKILHKI